MAAAWDARLAIHAGITLEVYLLHRRARLLGELGVDSGRLPLEVEVETGGALSVKPGAPAEERRAAWFLAFQRNEGWPALRSAIQLAQADVARLTAVADAQRRRVDELNRELAAAASGRAIADPTDELQAQQMGRPAVPPPLGLALRAFCLALLATEAWQLLAPSLSLAGVSTAHLVAELRHNPLAVGFGALFAVGAATSMFVFAHLGVRRLVAAGPASARQTWAGVLAAAAVAAAIAWSIASVRPGGRGPLDPRYVQLALFLAALAIPFTAAWLLALSRRLDAIRDAALAHARAWDAEHYRVLADLSRRARIVADEERRLARFESERAAAATRLRSLHERGATAERLAADAVEADEEQLARAARAIVAALELDRYEYLRQAMGAVRAPSPERETRAAPIAPVPAPEEAAERVERNLGLAG
jgi:hypothetical protein